MTTPTAAYVRLVIAGDISANQTWSTGISMSPPPALVSQSDLDGLLAAVKPLVTAWWGTTASTVAGFNTVDTRVTSLKAYLYSGVAGGQAALQAQSDYTTPLPGISSTALPTQTCLVATMFTGLPGRSFRGRNYMPMTGKGLNPDHQVAQADLTNLATAWKTLLDGINSVSAPEFGRVVVRGSRGSFPITSVRIDSEPDIQRRRGDKILGIRRATAVLT